MVLVMAHTYTLLLLRLAFLCWSLVGLDLDWNPHMARHRTALYLASSQVKNKASEGEAVGTLIKSQAYLCGMTTILTVSKGVLALIIAVVSAGSALIAALLPQVIADPTTEGAVAIFVAAVLGAVVVYLTTQEQNAPDTPAL
jgi:glycogen synthase